jgi:hypothetical protein
VIAHSAERQSGRTIPKADGSAFLARQLSPALLSAYELLVIRHLHWTKKLSKIG